MGRVCASLAVLGWTQPACTRHSEREQTARLKPDATTTVTTPVSSQHALGSIQRHAEQQLPCQLLGQLQEATRDSGGS